MVFELVGQLGKLGSNQEIQPEKEKQYVMKYESNKKTVNSCDCYEPTNYRSYVNPVRLVFRKLSQGNIPRVVRYYGPMLQIPQYQKEYNSRNNGTFTTLTIQTTTRHREREDTPNMRLPCTTDEDDDDDDDELLLDDDDDDEELLLDDDEELLLPSFAGLICVGRVDVPLL